MNKTKIVAIVAIVACITLAINLVGAVFYYSNIVNQQKEHIVSLEERIASLEKSTEELREEISQTEDALERLRIENKNLTERLSAANNLTKILMEAINAGDADKLRTIVVHVSQKGEGYKWGNTPNVTYTYNQIRNLTTYETLLLPEFEGNLNWTETYAWLKENFAGIPIALSVFEGGDLETPTVKLTTDEIVQAMSTCNVRMVKLSEIVSWYLGSTQSFPTDYVKSILSFCRQYGLKVLWSEWKVGENVFQRIKNCITGYEDMVTVLYQTNDKYNEPVVGFMEVSSRFEHWGASIQSWYWTSRYHVEPTNMPVSLLAWHALLAKNMGAEVLQFEPYWYFFDNGEPKSEFNTLKAMVF